MEWRCEWCGKPHEEEDPPCDNCGHGTFERAVVPVAGSEAGSNATVWVCTECGSEHVKHTPPCNRCGNHTLEKRVQEFDDAETDIPGYLDLLTPRYVAGLVVALALASAFALGAAGVVDLPGFGTSVPDVSDVPGNATAAGDVSLTAVETSYLAALDAERRAADQPEFTRDGTLDEIAAFYNQRRVKAAVGEGSRPSQDRMRSLLGGPCEGDIVLLSPQTRIEPGDSAETLGQRLAQRSLDGGDVGDISDTKTGVDVHVGPDGTVYLAQFVC